MRTILEERYDFNLEVRAKVSYFASIFFQEHAIDVLAGEKEVTEYYKFFNEERFELWHVYIAYKKPIISIGKNPFITVRLNGLEVGIVEFTLDDLEDFI